jgi:hypothetical protein
MNTRMIITVAVIVVVGLLLIAKLNQISSRSNDQINACNICTGWGDKGTMMRDICDEQNHC